MNNNFRFAFFGTSHIARFALEEIATTKYIPSLIVTAPDAPQGRGHVMTPSVISEWADAHNIPTYKPEKITAEIVESLSTQGPWDLFVVIDYGYILPKDLLAIPRKGVINIHPSLLPHLRGPSPLRSAILTDQKENGVTVMLMDEKMDHGPIIAQEHLTFAEWPPRIAAFEETMVRAGGKLCAEVLPKWMNDEIEAHTQNHADATFCKMIQKEDGLLELSQIHTKDEAYRVLLKIRAYEGWPGTYAFFERNGTRIRAKIIDAELASDGSLHITRVTPEGKREMSYDEFFRSGATPIASSS